MGTRPPSESSASRRIARALVVTCAALQLATFLLGTASLAAVAGDRASALPWLHVLYVAAAAATCALGVAGWTAAGRSTRASTSRSLGLGALLAVAWLLGLRQALALPMPEIAVLACLSVTVLSLQVAQVLMGSPRPLLLCLPLVLTGLVLFVGQVAAPRDPIAWSDALGLGIPRIPPLTHPGGRLQPGLQARMESKEASRGVRLATNSEGFRNRDDLAHEPAPGELRVLNLGDSFSIGMQADQEAFLGPLLERHLSELGVYERVSVLNAEISDPAHALHYYQSYGGDYAPSVVLLGLCGNDLQQTELFCGAGAGRLLRWNDAGWLEWNPENTLSEGLELERYVDVAYDRGAPRDDHPGRSPGLPAPLARLASDVRALALGLGRFHLAGDARRWLGIEDHAPRPMFSYLAAHEARDGRMRLLDGTANLGFFHRDPIPMVEDMYRSLGAVLEALRRAAALRGARLVVVVYPQRYQVDPADWALLVRRWGLDEQDFDLRLYNRRLAELCSALEIPCCDLIEPFVAAGRSRQLFLPEGDMHINAAGHRLAAEELARFLSQAGALPSAASLRPGAPQLEAAVRLAAAGPLRPGRFEADCDSADGGLARFLHGPFAADREEHIQRLILRGASSASTSVRYDLPEGAHGFRARVWAYGYTGERPDLALEAWVDGSRVWSGRVRVGQEPQELALPLDGARRLELRTGPRADAGDKRVVILSNPCFERQPHAADGAPTPR